MNVEVIKTQAVRAAQLSLTDLLDESIQSLSDSSVVVITSKIVSLCENAVVPMDGGDREALIVQEADLYLPKTLSQYGHHFSVKYNTLIASAGIDESNGDGFFILWPRDPWKTAEDARVYLEKKFNVKNIGILISDSTCQPLRRGTIGISLAHSGFNALNDYIGKPDIFGRPFSVSTSNIANGLASASVVAMGEGAEQTPLAIISNVPFVNFTNSAPSTDEINELNISLEEDLFAPFFNAVEWKTGNSGN
ncbi:MAG: putative folate metabolism gamma-glutamate ligase [Candidatus Saccharibacteria bacterium]|nr:putative folate metabolism gamma-glutamate ligase [Candidatus Saccharibacteria bacterium]